jgi:hypothetical protein
MTKRALMLICASTLAAAFVGSTIALGQATHPRQGAAPGITPKAFTTTQGGACAAAADTRTDILVPPDDSTVDNAPAGAVALTKTCDGITIGTLTTETNTSGAGDFIHLDMFADCVAAAAQPNPCTVGQRVFAFPGHTFVQTVQAGTQTHTMSMVWPSLQKGRWRFFAKVGGNNHAFVDFRTFTVVTY